MDGGLAQVICLVAHGGEWLATREGDPPRPERGNSTFQYVADLGFEFNRAARPQLRARDVADWLVQLAERDVQQLWLAVEERRASPSGVILATGGGKEEVWRGSWTLGDRDAPDRRIWRVGYHGTPEHGIAAPRSTIDAAQEELLASLADARALATDHELSEWVEWFAAAEALAAADEPVPRFHPDMLPATGYGEPARRLLAIATGSWVFGGMGSWGDSNALTDDERFDTVTQRLHDAMWRAFTASINTRSHD